MSPAELVRYAKSKGLKAIAVTDHDTIDGLEEALEEGKRIGIEVIPGLEISVDFYPEMHILGYFFKATYGSLAETLGELKNSREQRNPRIINKLNEMGFHITMNEVEAYTNGGLVGRPHIAMAMADKGYVATAQEAFNLYLASGRPAFFKKD
jgi:predicted metal-dependent phosphoesterase TrpH